MEQQKPARKKFRAADAPRPAPDLVARQMEAATLAFEAFGTAEAARDFLNSADGSLGGRPIDIAGSSHDGLRRVVDAMSRRSPSMPA